MTFRIVRQIFINGGLALTAVAIALVAADHTLGLLGYPEEIPIQVTHPPHVRQLKQNIEFQYEFRTNSEGLRNDELPLKKPQGERRVLVVGDSITEGIGAAQNETISAFLEQGFREAGHQVRFLNGGLSGAGVVDYGRLIVKLAPRYEVDAVLICIFANDPLSAGPSALPEAIYMTPPKRWGWRRFAHAGWPRIYTQAELLMKKRAQAPTTAQHKDFLNLARAEALRRGIPAEEIARWEARLPASLVVAAREGRFAPNILTYGLLHPTVWKDSIDIDTEEANRRWLAASSVLTETVVAVRAMGKQVAVTYLPSEFQYDPRSHAPSNPWPLAGTVLRQSWLAGETEVQRRLRDWAAGHQVSYLDLTPAFAQGVSEGGTFNWMMDEHLTPAGNLFAAQRIGAWIRQGGVFDFLNGR